MIVTREERAPKGYSDDARWTRRERLSRNIRAIVVFVLALFVLTVVNQYFILHPLDPPTAKEWVSEMVANDPQFADTYCALDNLDPYGASEVIRSVFDDNSEPRATDVRVELQSRC